MVGYSVIMTKSDGKDCENLWKSIDSARGCKIVRTGIGSDYLRICPDEKPTLVEVKDGCHSISKTQQFTKQIAQKVGFDYEVKRCNCSSEKP